MRLLLNLLDMPWWGVLATAVAFAAVTIWFRITLPRRFEKLVHDAVLEVGSALKNAKVTVHSATAVPAPKDPSPYDADEDDEDFVAELDGQPWEEPGYNFYSIDVTITPAGEMPWDPTGLALVPADFAPNDATEACMEVCPLHSAEEFANGLWQRAPEREIHGPRRLRMLYAVRDGLRAMKFANGVTYFGHIDLPTPLRKSKSGSNG
jgi:hypothetical protein